MAFEGLRAIEHAFIARIEVADETGAEESERAEKLGVIEAGVDGVAARPRIDRQALDPAPANDILRQAETKAANSHRIV